MYQVSVWNDEKCFGVGSGGWLHNNGNATSDIKKKTIKLYTLFFIYSLSYFFGQPPCLVGILVPPPRIEPVPPTVEVWNPKY